MRSKPQALEVFVQGRHAGSIYAYNGKEMTFTYDISYDGEDLSLSMPRMLQRTHSGVHVLNWFDGVLPDGDEVRALMAEGRGYRGSNTFSLLRDYGLDLPGAVQVAKPEKIYEIFSSHIGGYRPIGREEIGERLAELGAGENRAWQDKTEHWSLGGNQSKLAFAKIKGVYYSCSGRAASNVIVKPGIRGLPAHALNEAFCMRLAKNAGLNAADCAYEVFGSVPALEVARYDRVASPGGDEIWRLHQEDFCQVFGCSPRAKYTIDGGPSSKNIIELLRAASSAESVLDFVDALFYNYLIAGTDAHAKNYSLLHIGEGRVELAPLYDIASYLPYRDDRKGKIRLAMSIGGQNRFGKLGASNIERLAAQAQVPGELLCKRLTDLSERVESAIEETLEQFSYADELEFLAPSFRGDLRRSCLDTARRFGRPAIALPPAQRAADPEPFDEPCPER